MTGTTPASADQTINLKYPVTYQGERIETLTMRRPKVRDMLAAAQKSDTAEGKELHVFADLTEVAPELIEEMEWIDYLALQKAYGTFLS